MKLIELDACFAAKEAEEFKELGISSDLLKDDITKMTIDLNDFSSCNESSRSDRTTIRLKNGNSFEIDMDYNQFKAILFDNFMKF